MEAISRDEKKIAEGERLFADGKTWAKVHYWTSDLAFDVQKTDSLVSPFTATLDFICNENYSARLATADAKSIPRNECTNPNPVHCKASFAHQDGEWVFKRLLTKSAQNSEWRDDVSFLSLREILEKALKDRGN